jgi:hypothetical protein
MPHTRASLLRSSLSFHLGKVRIRIGRQYFPLGLPESMRQQIVADVVNEMRRYGRWAELDQEVPDSGPGHSTPDNYYGDRQAES